MMIGAAAVAVGAMLPLSAMADAVRVYDVDDYVQDGLVVHFDGIRNAGADVAHNASATTWKNLVTGQPDAEFVDDTGNWNADGYYFKGTSTAYAKISSPGVTLGKYATIQLALDAVPSENTARYTGFFRLIVEGNSKAEEHDSLTFWSGYGDSVATITLKDDAYSGKNNRSALTGWEGKYVTAMLGHENKYLFQGTTPENSKKRSSIQAVPQATYSFGGAGIDADNRWFKGTYHSLRIYTNELSEAQLVQNRVVDDARYRNEASKGKGNDDVNVIVASNAEGVEGTEESGKWYIAEGTHTFTAPATTVIGAKFYTLSGYTVETWDGSAWGAAVTNSGASYTASSSAKVRLTWLWTLTLRGAAAYDVGDYVQDGLVAHFDGIRNAGVDTPHSSDTTTWKNLAVGYPDATLTFRPGRTSSTPSWTDTAYSFDDDAIFSTDDTLDLGTNFTVQIAITADPSAQSGKATVNGHEDTSKYNAWFNDNPKNDYGFWTDGTSTSLVGNFNKFKSDSVYIRPTISNWGGRYVTWMLDGDNKTAYTFESATSSNSKTYTPNATVHAARRYSWGAEINSGGNMQAFLKGEYHNVRIYNRTLTDAELKQNRRIDDIRYREVADVTVVNGAIGDTGTNGESSLTDGVYNIETGTWTITAPEIKSGGHTYQPKLLVEMYNATTGEWETTTAKPQWANSYTIDKSALGNGRIRLTWTWQIRKGLIISFF